MWIRCCTVGNNIYGRIKDFIVLVSASLILFFLLQNLNWPLIIIVPGKISKKVLITIKPYPIHILDLHCY